MDDRPAAVQTVTIVFLCLSSAFVFLRFTSRTLIVRHVLIDDWIILFAWALSFGFSFSILWAVRNGLGLHNIDIPPDEVLPLRKAEYAFSVLYNPVLMATKTSILVFYIRNLFSLEKIWRNAAYVVLLVVNIAGLALTLVNIFQCAPLSAVFDAIVPDATCSVDLVVLYLASAPVNILTDLAILVLPLPVLSRMRMTGKAKGILLATFSAGAFVAVVDVIRIASLETAYEAQLAAKTSGVASVDGKELLGQDDFSYYGALSFMWSAVEIHVGIMCACVPSLKPLAAKFIPKLIHESHGASGSRSAREGVLSARLQSETLSPRADVPIETRDARIAGDSSDADADSMDMATFLSETQIARSTTNTSRDVDLGRRDTLLTFYDVHRSKVLTELSTRRSILPIAQVTLLFFLWGVSYGFLTNLNSQFQIAVNQTAGQAVSIHAAYYAAYFFSPLLFERWILKRWGFKATFITGLWIYAVGTLIFWPSAVLYSFPAFVISNFVVGMGVSTLEVGANIFLALCGPMEYAEVRLNLSQAVQGIGTVFATTLAQKVLFKDVSMGTSLIDVQWTYLAITFVDVILSVAFYYMIVPEVSDAQLEELALASRGVKDEIAPTISPSSSPASSKTLTSLTKRTLSPTTKIAILGCVAIFLYVSAQECLAYYFKTLIATSSPSSSSLDSADFLSLGTSTFAIGRFLTAGALFLLPPRHIISILLIGTALFAALATFLPSTSSAMPACLILMDLFEGGLFPTIFANTLRGQGSLTKDIASYLVAATSGGAIGPAIMYGISLYRSIQLSFVTAMAFALAGLVYPLYTTLDSRARRIVDPDPSPRFGTQSLVFAMRYTWRETVRLAMWPRRPEHRRGYERRDGKRGHEHVERVRGSDAADYEEKIVAGGGKGESGGGAKEKEQGEQAELTLGLGLDLGINDGDEHR